MQCWSYIKVELITELQQLLRSFTPNIGHHFRRQVTSGSPAQAAEAGVGQPVQEGPGHIEPDAADVDDDGLVGGGYHGVRGQGLARPGGRPRGVLLLLRPRGTIVVAGFAGTSYVEEREEGKEERSHLCHPGTPGTPGQRTASPRLA